MAAPHPTCGCAAGPPLSHVVGEGRLRRFATVMLKDVVAYTDGACKGNPGRGGWGAWLRWNEHEKRLCGGEALTTNNRMELMAAIQALEALREPCRIVLNTDSTYVMKGITEWMPGWKRKNWKTSDGKPVKNVDLWQRLDTARLRHEVDWRWVRGHNGDVGNELADQLANEGILSIV